jgi:hypothetical protein
MAHNASLLACKVQNAAYDTTTVEIERNNRCEFLMIAMMEDDEYNKGSPQMRLFHWLSRYPCRTSAAKTLSWPAACIM